jgi:menaquinone-dependent protoporphyrinogen oxidase
VDALTRLTKARDHRSFAGAIERSHWPLTGHLFLRALGGRYGDHRNWDAIEQWADEIARSLTA